MLTYNTKKIRKEKEQLQESMSRQKAIGGSVIASLSGAVLFLNYRNRKLKKRYRQNFEELMAKDAKQNSNSPSTIPYSESELGFSKDLADALVKRLDKFEKNQGYIQPNLDLAKLASILQTNQKYTTKILAHYRGKGTIEYISDLRIEYIVEKLKSDSRFRRYKNKSLSDEAGFGSTQIFTRTFKNKMGMPPTFYINELQKLDENQKELTS